MGWRASSSTPEEENTGVEAFPALRWGTEARVARNNTFHQILALISPISQRAHVCVNVPLLRPSLALCPNSARPASRTLIVTVLVTHRMAGSAHGVTVDEEEDSWRVGIVDPV